MRQNRKKIWWLLLAGAVLLGCLACVVSYNKNTVKRVEVESSRPYVAVITKSTTSAFWKSVYAGANAACTEYNLTLTFEGPESEEDYETQNEMVDRAVENGAKVIVFSAVDFNANAEAIDRAARQGVKIVVIDSDVNSSQVSCRISTDNYQAGRMAAYAVLGGEKPVQCVGIVNYDKNSANGQQREAGFREVLEGEEGITIVDTINVRSTTEDAKQGTMRLLEENPQIDALVTFNEWTSLGVGYAIQEMGLADSTRVVAFDSNVVSVGMLETGEVDALIVQNPYAMGYLGIEYAYNLIYGLPIENTEMDTATTLVTGENMYDPACQRALFSFD